LLNPDEPELKVYEHFADQGRYRAVDARERRGATLFLRGKYYLSAILIDDF
jgi:hypothetical protein